MTAKTINIMEAKRKAKSVEIVLIAALWLLAFLSNRGDSGK
jgi:hypothetical protein